MFPEAWRTLALNGADIFCNTANLVYPYCLKAMEVRSMENGVYSIVANRIGIERGNKFFGNSKIIDVRGDMIKQSSSEGEEVNIVEVDIEKARNKQWNPFNDLFKNRRTDLYMKLGKL